MSSFTPGSKRHVDAAARTRYSALAKVERVREIAFNAYIDGMHFHEVAIRDPFEAEREYQALASRITELLGPPKGVRVVKLPDSPSAATVDHGATLRAYAEQLPVVLSVSNLREALRDAADEIERLREQVNTGRTGRERTEGLPEGTLPRV